MSAYEKPMIHVVPEQAEGIFMASGDKTVCLAAFYAFILSHNFR